MSKGSPCVKTEAIVIICYVPEIQSFYYFDICFSDKYRWVIEKTESTVNKLDKQFFVASLQWRNLTNSVVCLSIRPSVCPSAVTHEQNRL